MQSPSILVVDDDQITVARITHLLARWGLTFESAADGVSAIAMLRDRDYAVIVLDLLMPKLDGFGVLQFISEHRPELRRRVIVATSLTDASGGAPKLEGTWAVITKPIDYEELSRQVLACIEETSTDAWAERLIHG